MPWCTAPAPCHCQDLVTCHIICVIVTSKVYEISQCARLLARLTRHRLRLCHRRGGRQNMLSPPNPARSDVLQSLLWISQQPAMLSGLTMQDNLAVLA